MQMARTRLRTLQFCFGILSLWLAPVGAGADPCNEIHHEFVPLLPQSQIRWAKSADEAAISSAQWKWLERKLPNDAKIKINENVLSVLDYAGVKSHFQKLFRDGSKDVVVSAGRLYLVHAAGNGSILQLLSENGAEERELLRAARLETDPHESYQYVLHTRKGRFASEIRHGASDNVQLLMAELKTTLSSIAQKAAIHPSELIHLEFTHVHPAPDLVCTGAKGDFRVDLLNELSEADLITAQTLSRGMGAFPIVFKAVTPTQAYSVRVVGGQFVRDVPIR